MKVEIDHRSGFCFGVVNAISSAERSLQERGRVYCLGDIVHNRVEVERLGRMGLAGISHSQMKDLAGEAVLVRAHGEPPTTYSMAERSGVEIIDATCPVVARLQRKVTEAYDKMAGCNGQVVILGKRGHAEVVGLAGQVGGNVLVIEKPEDVNVVDPARPVYLLSQTTQSLELFGQVRDLLIARAHDPSKVIVDDTICRQVSNREPHLREFARRYDVVIFVAGRESSNGKLLYEVCRQSNPRSYMVEDETELEDAMFAGAENIGVCGATSTPGWLMEQVAEKIKNR